MEITKEKLVDKLLAYAFLFDIKNKPGEVIHKLSKDEKEVCKTLTYKDFWRRIK